MKALARYFSDVGRVQGHASYVSLPCLSLYSTDGRTGPAHSEIRYYIQPFQLADAGSAVVNMMDLLERVMIGRVQSRLSETFSFLFRVLEMNSLSCRFDAE